MPTTTIKPENLSIHDAAERLGVHDCTIRRAISRGEIQAVRLGPRLIRIPVNQLEAWARPIPTAGNVA